MNNNDPYYFPFQVINYLELIAGDDYYIKLNDRVIHSFLDNRRNLPVSHVKGTFVRLHTEIDRTSSVEYAVFKNVRILNKNYKLGLCNQMLIRYPEGFLAGSGGCDTFSDSNENISRRRTINQDREVFFNIRKWVFGVPTEQSIMENKGMDIIKKKITVPDMITEIKEFRGNKPGLGGKKINKTQKKKKKKTYKKKNKFSRNRRTYRNY